MADIPGLTILRKTHKTPRVYHNQMGEKFNCNQFKNLTYKNMEAYISGLPNSSDILPAFTFLKNCGSLVQAARYTATRNWFLAQFPKYHADPLYYIVHPVKLVDITTYIEEMEQKRKNVEKKKAEKKDAE